MCAFKLPAQRVGEGVISSVALALVTSVGLHPRGSVSLHGCRRFLKEPPCPRSKYVLIWNVKKIFLLLEKRTKDIESLKASLQAEKEFKSKVLKTSIKCHVISYIPNFKHQLMYYFYPIQVLQREPVPI